MKLIFMKHLLQSTGNKLLAAAFIALFGAGTIFAQTFPSPGFVLPNGKTIVITYEVDVNANACPTGNLPGGGISNQSNVSGSNFATVQTDDPDISGTSNPTLTPFSSLTLGNLVYKDVNRDGDYDTGTDLGVNGVTVRLFLDNGDNVLTGADGAAIATTTTATVMGQAGVYSFAVCPGNYIVEIASSNFAPGGALYDNGLMAALVSSPVGGAPDPDNDVDNDDNGDAVSGFGVASQAITLAYGTEPVNDGDTDNNTNMSLDFGFKTPTTVTINDVTMNEGTGGGTTAFAFTVTRNDNAEAFNLTVNTNNGTAVEPGDYTAISGGTVSFTAGGSLTATVTVLVNQDNIVEANETFTVDLSGAPGGVTIADGSGLGTITNDDAAVVTLTGGASQNEGTSFTFTATLNNPVQGGFMLAYTTNNGTATTADNDYTDNDGSLSFTGTAGETKTITVNTTADNKVELDETFTVALGAFTGAPAGVTTAGSPQTGTILNDDAAVVALAGNVSQLEATTPQAFSVTLSNPVDVNVTVQFSTSNGTATTADNDYNGIAGQTVTFNAGSTSPQTVNVTINNDNKVEADEVYNVAIGTLAASGRNVSLGTSAGTGTILNDDSAVVTLSGGGAANEGNTGTTPRVFTATLNNPVQGGFSVAYTTNDGTATTADMDYVDNDGSLTFAGTAGEAKTITVLVNGDHKVEANETFTVALGAISGAPSGVTTAGSPQTATITNDEVDFGDAPDIGSPFYATLLSSNGARHQTVLGVRLGATIDGENDGQPTGDATGDGADEDGVTWPAVLVKGTTANITVNASAPGFLNAWVDFEFNATWSEAGNKIFNNFPLLVGDNNLSFAVPVSASSTTTFARFRFSTAGNDSYEGAAADGEVEDYAVTIVDNQFSIDNPTVTEGNAGTTNLTFTISRTTNANASSVDYAITGGTATSGSDYAPFAGGTINFTAGGPLSQTVTVTVNGDLVVEDNETVIMTLSNPVNGGIGSSPGTGTITNDDSANLTLSGGTAQNEGNAGTVAYTFTATLSAAVQGGFQVSYTTNDGTATTADNDYVDNDGTLTFTGTAGETKTITVQVNGDNKVELNENFTVALGTIANTSAVQAAAITKVGSPQTGTITNDDAAVVAIAANVSQAENLTPQAFSVTISNPVDVAVTVQFSTSNGTATTADNDYNGIAGQTVTFNAGTTTPQTVNVTINNDNKVEADEVFNVAIGTLAASGRNVSLGTSTRTGTILNDDAAVVTLSGGGAANEGNTGTTPRVFTATLNNPVQGGFTANYVTNDGTATVANNDYVDNDGSLSFAGTAGETQTFTVLVNGDLNIEADETFQTAITGLTGVVNPPAVTIAGSPQTATIINDEQDWGDAPTAAQSGFAGSYPTLAADNGARHGAALGGLRLGATIDADLDGQPNANATGDGADEDGVTLPGALVINTSANITVNASATGKLDAWVDFNRDGDWLDAGEQVFTNQNVVAGNNTLSFAVPGGASLGNSFARFRLSTAGNLASNGAAADGEVEDYAVNIVNTQFSINDPSVNEGNAGTTNLTFTVTRTNNASACSIDYAITGGTATVADNDYQPLANGTLSFTAGGVLTMPITVVVNGDNKVELNETVDITLSNPVNASILDGSGTGTIVNDDAAVITITSPTVVEGDVGTSTALSFTIAMSNPSDANVVVNYNTVDGSATIANNDYQAASGTLTYTPGQQSKTVMVTVNGDCLIEPNESFLLRLSALMNNGRNVTLSGGGATLDGTGSITNDDALPVITCPASLSRNVDPGVCTTSVTLPLPTTSSICGTSVLEFHYRTVDANNNPTGPYNAYALSSNNTVIFTRGRYEIEWRVTDGSGSSVCSYYLTVIDNQAPLIVCPANLTLAVNASCTATIGAYAPVSLSDNCTPNGQILLSQSPAAGSLFSGHNTVVPVKLSADDGNGNVGSCTFNITLRDITLPVALCKNLTVNIGANGSVVVQPNSINNGSSDNCGFTLTLTPNTFNCNNIGLNTVTLRATDVAGNTATCTATVMVQDVTPPNAICANPNVYLDNTGHATLTPAQMDNGSTDNCGSFTRSISRTEFNCSELQGSSWPVTLTLTDMRGNTSSCLGMVTVKDIIPPTAVCEDVTVKLGSNGKATVYGANLAANSTDNCSVWSYSPIAKVYTAANLGVNYLTITVKDYSGNPSTCVSQVTVLPFSAPPDYGDGGDDRSLFSDYSDEEGVFDVLVYPNPTTGDAMIAFELTTAQPFAVRVFDLSGRMVFSRQSDGVPGENYQPINLEGIASGVYIVDFQSEGLKVQKRLVVQQR